MSPPAPDRRVAVGTTVVGLVAFVALAWWLVPWHPVPGGSPAAVDAKDYFTAPQLDRGRSIERWSLTWSLSSLVVSLLAYAWLALGRRPRSWWSRLPGRWPVQVLLAVVVVSLIVRLVTLPFGIALRSLSRRNGLSTQSWIGYFIDVTKNEAVSIVPTVLALLVLIACAKRWRRWWPAIVGGLLASFVVLGSYVYPIVVEPLFNDFQPLPAGELRTDIMSLADAEGVQLDDVLVADASRRTTTLNAYVSGFGDTRRVVLYDNTVEDLGRAETLAVVAHELGHARDNDVGIGTALGAAGALLGVGLLGLVLAVGERRGRPGAAQAAAVPAVLALVAIATLLSAPVQNGVSRQLETRADVTSLRFTDDPAAFVELQRQLTLRSRSDPDPIGWVQWWWGSHPTTVERIALATRSSQIRNTS